MHLVKTDRLISFTVICMLILGVLYNVFLPMASVPDEPTHFSQAYALSNRMMGIQSDFTNGIVVSEVGLRTDSGIGINTDLCKNNNLSSLNYFWSSYGDENNKILVPDSGYRLDTNLVITAYIPTAIGITLARIMKFSWQLIYVTGRLFNLLFFVIIIALAMKCSPDLKNAIAAIGLLPSVIWIAASYSYDGWNIAFAILFVALCMKISQKDNMVSFRDIFTLFLIFILLVPIKYVYAPIVLSVLLIQRDKWPKWMLFFIGIGSLLSIVLLYVLRGNEIVRYLTTNSMDVRGMSDVSGYELSYTLSYVINNPVKVFLVFFNTVVNNLDSYIIKSIIGEFYSSYVPGGIIYFVLALFIIIMATSISDHNYSKYKHNFGLMLCTMVIIILIIFAAFLFTFSQIDNNYVGQIGGMQGRYFIPVFICLPFIIHSSRFINLISDSKLGKEYNKKFIYVMAILSAVTFVFKSIGMLSA